MRNYMLDGQIIANQAISAYLEVLQEKCTGARYRCTVLDPSLLYLALFFSTGWYVSNLWLLPVPVAALQG